MWAHGIPIAAQLDCAMSVRTLVCQTLDDLGKATGLKVRFAVWSTRISDIERSADISRGTCTTGLTRLPPHAAAVGKPLHVHD
jgi:hypothetical protein